MNKQRLELREKLFAEGCNRIMVGRQVARKIAVGDCIPAGLLDLSGGEDAVGVAVEEHGEKDLWRIGRSSPIAIAGIESGEVEFLNDINNKAGDMLLGKTIAQSHGAIQHLLVIGGFELSTHCYILTYLLESGEAFSPTSC